MALPAGAALPATSERARVAAAAPSAAPGSHSIVGRRLADVLVEATGPAFRLIYNAEIVPPSLRVLAEPAAGDAAARIAALLAPHGLALQRIVEGTYAVVRAPKPPPDPSAAPTMPPSGEVEPVVVTASRYGFAAPDDGSHVFLTSAQVERLPALGDEPLRAVHRLPGTASDGLSGLAHIRGGEARETLVVLDGLALHAPFHLRNFLSPVSVLDARAVGTMDVWTGGFTAAYGDSLSAVADARTRTVERERELGASLFHAHALAAGALAGDRGDWFVLGRRSYVGALTELAGSAIGEPDYGDAFGRVRWSLAPATVLEFRVLRGHDDITIGDRRERARAAYGNGYAWATLTHHASSSLQLSALASHTDVESVRRGVVTEEGRRGRVDDERTYGAWSLQFDADWDPGPFRARAGVATERMDAELRYAGEVAFDAGTPFPASPAVAWARQAVLDGAARRWTAYATVRWAPAAALGLEAGVRHAVQSGDAGDRVTEPRLGLLWELGDGWRLRGSLGRYHQFQALDELAVEDGEREWHGAQRADHAIVGLERDFARVRLRVEAHRKRYARSAPRYENRLDPLAVLPELRWDRQRVAPTSATARGLEVLLSAPDAAPARWWFSYTLAEAVDRIDERRVPRAWDQRHAFAAGFDWSRGLWEASAALTLRQGWRTTRLTIDRATGAASYGPANGERLAAFGSLDLRGSRRWSRASGELLGFVELTNATGRRNPCCRDYTVSGGPGAYLLSREDETWPRFVPQIGLRWKWR